ncbi:hypothetical protein AZE42_12156 [Rhizopogon vesiculosus]|uniref:Uncharacterized protein n=1 Tax=Rhizopogon vesiculosus TaxID=180088 RepID=A0A1J8Q0J0_9AGAM|nr:hypothetical protein AZE42_12156 [Rhizopogon vesiculosus]
MDDDPELAKLFGLRKCVLSALHRAPFESPELRKHSLDGWLHEDAMSLDPSRSPLEYCRNQEKLH